MPEAFTGTARFELIRRLGEGGFGIVYEAFDRKRSARVALKLLRQAEGAALYRFKREFRALADVSHPNLVALDELLTDGWHWFFTMELVDGLPLVSYARHPDGAPGPGQLDEARLRRVLPQLAAALNAIHRLGIVHCDIKPSNVLVTSEGRVVVLDFGLVSERLTREATDQDDEDELDADLVVLGTPAYMAPEQATPEAVTPAADWYSVGVMMYETLTGCVPFSGSNVEVIEAKQFSRPRRPRDLDPRVPKDLLALSLKLLDPDPTRRPSGEEVLRRVGHAERRPPSPLGVAPPEGLLGREPHLRALADALEMTLGGEAVVTFVSGLSGMGKTALIRHFLHEQRAADPELLALTSRCYERESMPYKAIDPLIDALAQHLQRLTDLEVARLLPRDAGILARVFPVLLGVEEFRRAPAPAIDTLDSLHVRQRAASALRDLLFALAIRTPLVLVIDDVHWGDADSASILQEVLRPPDAPPLLLIAAYRSEEAGEARLLRALSQSIQDSSGPRIQHVEVGALTPQDARELAARLTAGARNAADRAEAIARESGGNAFFVHELAQHASTVGSPTRLGAVVLDRVGAIPEAAQRLVRAIALSAQSIPAQVAEAAAGLDPQDRESLQLLRASRLVRAQGGPDEPNIETYHDRIREAVVSQLHGPELVEWHRRLAEAWEQSGLARPETLVLHYRGAGDRAKTSQYAVAAADIAQDALAFDRAAEFFGLLADLEPDPVAQRHWLIKLGDALANAGRGREAASAFLKALDQTTGDESIEIERRAASELIRAGYLDDATEVLDRLLPKVGVRPPTSDTRALMSVLWYYLLLAVRGTGFHERDESQIAPDVLRRIDVLTSISAPLSLCSLIQGTALSIQATWHALRAGEPRRVVMGLTGLAALTSLRGVRTERRALGLVDEAQAIAARLQDPWATGRTLLAEGMVLKLNGHWKRGVERLERAIEIFATCVGVRWDIETAQLLLHDALYWMGDWSRLARELPARRYEAEQRGDLYSITHVAARLSPLVHLAADRVDHARAEADSGLAQWTKRQFQLQHRFAVCTGVDIDLYTGHPADASRRLTEAWPHLKSMLFVFQHHRIEMVFYRARIALALGARGDGSALRRAEQDAHRLEHERAPWAGAFARLVRATIAHARQPTQLAAAELESAEMALRRCDMHLYAAAAQYRRGTLVGGETGRELVDNAREWMHTQQVVNPERMVDLLAPGCW